VRDGDDSGQPAGAQCIASDEWPDHLDVRSDAEHEPSVVQQHHSLGTRVAADHLENASRRDSLSANCLSGCPPRTRPQFAGSRLEVGSSDCRSKESNHQARHLRRLNVWCDDMVDKSSATLSRTEPYVAPRVCSLRGFDHKQVVTGGKRQASTAEGRADSRPIAGRSPPPRSRAVWRNLTTLWMSTISRSDGHPGAPNDESSMPMG
jgi:hypothetical protein